MALQGDQGWVLFKWMKRGAIIWCLPRGPKSRSQVLESSWGMLSTWPGEQRASVSELQPPGPGPALLQMLHGQLGAPLSYQPVPIAAKAICSDQSEAINKTVRSRSILAAQPAVCRAKQPKLVSASLGAANQEGEALGRTPWLITSGKCTDVHQLGHF